MGCGCGKKTPTGESVEFVHTAPDGTETIRQTEVEARAMEIRLGGKWEKRPVS